MGWMIKFLHLKGNELLVYAIIHGFCQDGETQFSGSVSYLQAWTGLSYQGVVNVLKSLVEKGLIEKTSIVRNGIIFCQYQTLYPPKNFGTPSQKSCDNIDNDINISTKVDKIDNKGNRFIKPSLEDIRAYCQERGNAVDPETFYDFYQSKGWKVGNQPMKDWKAAVRTWEKSRDNRTAPAPRRRTTVTEDLLALGREMFGEQNNFYDEQ